MGDKGNTTRYIDRGDIDNIDNKEILVIKVVEIGVLVAGVIEIDIRYAIPSFLIAIFASLVILFSRIESYITADLRDVILLIEDDY